MSKSKIHHSPRLTFSSLAKLMSPQTPISQYNILSGHKYPQDGPVLSYVNATRQLVSILKNGTHNGRPLRSHEQDVVSAFNANPVKLPRGVSVLKKRPNTKQKHWNYHGVDVSVFPDVLLVGPNGTGALKLFPNKDPLGRGVGRAMATLLHHYMSSIAQDPRAQADYCLVYEIRKGSLYKAGIGSVAAKSLNKARAACAMTTAIWPTL